MPLQAVSEKYHGIAGEIVCRHQYSMHQKSFQLFISFAFSIVITNENRKY